MQTHRDSGLRKISMWLVYKNVIAHREQLCQWKGNVKPKARVRVKEKSRGCGELPLFEASAFLRTRAFDWRASAKPQCACVRACACVFRSQEAGASRCLAAFGATLTSLPGDCRRGIAENGEISYEIRREEMRSSNPSYCFLHLGSPLATTNARGSG